MLVKLTRSFHDNRMYIVYGVRKVATDYLFVLNFEAMKKRKKDYKLQHRDTAPYCINIQDIETPVSSTYCSSTPFTVSNTQKMWHDFSAHHTQRGDITAVVWGEPGSRPSLPKENETTEKTAEVVDSEELTKGRRAATPFVQQCDLLFPLPDSHGDVGSNGEIEAGCEEEEELQAEVRKCVDENIWRRFWFEYVGVSCLGSGRVLDMGNTAQHA